MTTDVANCDGSATSRDFHRQIVFTLTVRSSDWREGAVAKLHKRVNRELELALGGHAFELTVVSSEEG